MQHQLFHHLVANGNRRRKTGHRFLKNHRNSTAANDPQGFVVFQRQDINFALIQGQGDFAFRAVDSIVRIKPHQRFGGDRFTRAGLPHQAQNLPGIHFKRDIVHGCDAAFISIELQRQVFNRQQGHFFTLE